MLERDDLKRNVVVLGIDSTNGGQSMRVFGLKQVDPDPIVEQP